MKMNAQSKWGWEVAAYLFLAGLGAGAYIFGVIADMAGWSVELARIGVIIGLPCVLVGCIFLILDLGTPSNFWRAAMRPSTSWIARGTIIISLFMIINAVHIGLWIWPFASVLQGADIIRTVIGVIGVIFAFGTMIYTGILLGAARPIAFWSTALLPLLFMVSALSTGLMAIILIGSFTGAESEDIRLLAAIDIILIVFKILVLSFYLQATHRVAESRASAQLVLTGEVAGMFWFGVVVLGLLIPLVFGLLAHGTAWGAVVASICGIIGGLLLRKVVLAGGIYAPLKAGRFEYALPKQ
ncbi:MAG TPA: NrfD/PsrC family molybdoenzyme membrane anchor subunit [Acidobacteriota bacterium]|nr:NrfD/PsrC family molybdoenzyme membrane anchor subunit [Acidobacteriota bacterium]